MPDLTLIIYITIALVTTFGAWLFVWWLARNKFHASSVYLYVTILIIGEAIRSWINVKGRSLALANDGSFLPFTMEWIWVLRSVLTLVGMGAIVGHMTYRVIIHRDPNILEYWGDKTIRVIDFLKRKDRKQ